MGEATVAAGEIQQVVVGLTVDVWRLGEDYEVLVGGTVPVLRRATRVLDAAGRELPVVEWYDGYDATGVLACDGGQRPVCTGTVVVLLEASADEGWSGSWTLTASLLGVDMTTELPEWAAIELTFRDP